MKGVVRAERLIDPDYFIGELIKRAGDETIISIYGVPSWVDADDFLDQLGKKSGKLLKGGEPDRKTVAKMVLYDWQRGKIPYFTRPPKDECKKDVSSDEEEEEVKEDGQAMAVEA